MDGDNSIEKIDIKKGQVVLFSEGAYADYNVILVCRALKDITKQTLKEYESKGWVKFPDCEYHSNCEFVSALLAEGVFEKVSTTEINLGYGEFSPYIV